MDMSALPKAAELASVGVRAPRWRPGLARENGAREGQAGSHSEIFASASEAGGMACALALALDQLRGEDSRRLEERSILWVQDEASLKRTGRPCRAGLPPQLRRRLVHVAAGKPEDALFALEEGLRCRDLACVIGEITGNPRALDFTASRRLSLAAEKHGVPLFLVRLDAQADLSSARMRWQVRSAPSRRPRWNAQAPGAPAWHAQLFRARAHAPGEWILCDDGQSLAAEKPPEKQPGTAAPDHGDLAGTSGGGSLAAR